MGLHWAHPFKFVPVGTAVPVDSKHRAAKLSLLVLHAHLSSSTATLNSGSAGNNVQDCGNKNARTITTRSHACRQQVTSPTQAPENRELRPCGENLQTPEWTSREPSGSHHGSGVRREPSRSRVDQREPSASQCGSGPAGAQLHRKRYRVTRHAGAVGCRQLRSLQ